MKSIGSSPIPPPTPYVVLVVWSAACAAIFFWSNRASLRHARQVAYTTYPFRCPTWLSLRCCFGISVLPPFLGAAASGGRDALARVAACVAYREHCKCLRDGDVQVEPRRSNCHRDCHRRLSACRRAPDSRGRLCARCGRQLPDIGPVPKTRSVRRRDSDGTVPAP